MSHSEPSPVRKRPRLSLRAGKKPAARLEVNIKSEPKDLQNHENEKEDKEIFCKTENPATQEDEHTGPGIIGFENLGNTCFLNSVLQILRFTPGFLEGLESINKEISQTEKLLNEINEDKKREFGEDFEKSQENLSWQVVKILNQLFTRMESREKRFRQLGNSAVVTMTVKPERLLDKIRQLNPMFEGYLQHDAQELLRCLLCYLQDGWKEISKVKAEHKKLEIKRNLNDRISNNILKYFEKGSCERLASCKSTPKSTGIETSSAKMALFKGDDLTGCADGQSKPCSSSNLDLKANHSIAKDVTKVAKDCSEQQKAVTEVKPHTTTSGKPPCSYDETDGPSVKHDADLCAESNTLISKVKRSSPRVVSPVTPVSASPSPSNGNSLRRSTRLSSNTPSPVSSDSQHNITPKFGRRRGNKRKKSVPKDVVNAAKPKAVDYGLDPSPENRLVGGCMSQPSVLSMLGKREAGCKRLGMRGAVVTKVPSGIEAPESLQDKSAQETARTESAFEACLLNERGDNLTNGVSAAVDFPIKKTQSAPNTPLRPVSPRKVGLGRSPAKRCCGMMEHVSENNLKSAALQDIKQATVKLEKCDPVCDSPLKSVSANEALKVLGQPVDRQKDFVEHLFQGMMMLKTRCMECECARERREVFQDVSVPLKNSSSVDLEEDESEEEQEEASLSCLMSAFTDVERLCDDNKYFCENCFSYVEAERSLHYEMLPEILTLHLKRFAASSGYFGNLTKINDHVATPEFLPCLRYKCPRPCQRKDHRYRLYGLITHSGVSITSGHYMCYVRLLPDSRTVQQLQAHTEKDKSSGSQGLMDKVVVKGEKKDTRDIKLKEEVEEVDDQCATGCARGAAALPEDSVVSNGQSGATEVKVEDMEDVDSEPSGHQFVNKWLECDDDFVQVLDEEDFDRRMAPNSGYNATPYVLFYIRDNDGF